MKTHLAVTSLILSLGYAVILAGQLAGLVEFTLLTSPPVFIGSLTLVFGLLMGGHKLVKSRRSVQLEARGEAPHAGETILPAPKFRAPNLLQGWSAPSGGAGLMPNGRRGNYPKVQPAGPTASGGRFE